MKSAIRYPKEYENMVKSVKEDLALFNTYKEFLSFCASIALSNDAVDESFEDGDWSSQPIKIDIFNKGEYDRSLMDLIALHHTKDISILNGENDEEIFLIFEKYVAKGMEIFQDEVYTANNKTPFEDLTLYIDRARDNKQSNLLEEFTNFVD